MDNQNDLKFALGVRHQIFNNEVRKRREALGLTQKQLATKCGLGEGTLGHLETFRRYPTEDEAERLSLELNSTPEILFPKWLEFFKPKRTSVVTEHLVTERLLGNSEAFLLEAPDNFDDVDKQFLQDEIQKQLHTLSDREQIVLELRYGLNGNEPHSLQEVGALIIKSKTANRKKNAQNNNGITQERVRQIEAKALRKLRHPSRGNRLRPFLDETPNNVFLQCDKEQYHTMEIKFGFYYTNNNYVCERKVLNRSSYWKDWSKLTENDYTICGGIMKRK